jgi:hypothetical protein
MAIHWTIPFKSLRSGTLFTVNIHDASYSGNSIPLKGAAQPFTTEESQEEDQFMPIRTQSGYIRIFDNGKDASGNAFNWKSLLPETDTDRPVTLTDGGGNIVWQGFMQAQNFSGALYGNPQEREFPVQCSLTVCQGADINFQEKSIHNFAYLLKTIVVFWIPAHTVTFSLPANYQVLMSAFLSLALGFILTIKPKKKAE